MPEPTWLESRKNRNLHYFIGIPVILLAAGSLFFYNNREVFLKKQEQKHTAPDIRNARKEASHLAGAGVSMKDGRQVRCSQSPVESHQGIASSNQSRRQAPQNPAAEKVAETVFDTVLLPDVPCRLRGRDGMRVVLSLELHIAAGTFKKEVLLKRENLKVMVQKVLAAKTMDELIVDSLRIQTKTAMERILEHGTINDVIFRNFRIEKVDQQ